MEHLRALCDVLDVSLDEAVLGAPLEPQTGAEQKMLDLMRNMSDENIEIMLALASKMGRLS